MTTPAFAFLAARRSHPAKTLALPAPDPAQVAAILQAALRVPDHGKLEPWRILVLAPAARARLAALAAAIGTARGLDPEQVAKGRAQFADSPLTLAVIASPKDQPKIPLIEQTLSAGALCLNLLNAAHALGFGANWLTGWPAYDRGFAETGLGLAPQEWVAGFIHIGTVTTVPPDRPRPDPARVVTWVET
jgi:nitroreductase